MNDEQLHHPPRLAGSIKDGRLELETGGLSGFDYQAGTLRIVGFGRLRLADGTGWITQEDDNFGSRLLAVWDQSGRAMLEHLDGDFALLAWAGADRPALLSVDRFATHALYWRRSDRGIAFSTKPVQVSELLGETPAFNNQALLAYLYFHMIPAPLSVCKGVQRLDIGQAVSIQRGQAEVYSHWRASFDPSTDFSFPRERERFFAGLRHGVEANVAGMAPDSVGCFLSGGTDSSTLAGILTEVQGRPAKTFAIVFEEARYDERAYSRCAAGHFGTEHTEHLLTPEQTEVAIHAIASGYEQPFGNSSAVPTYVCAGLAKAHGVRRMLGGDGGDELFGGNTRYARAWVLSHYAKLPAAVRSSVLEPWLVDGGMTETSFWPIRKLRGYVEQAREPLPDQMDARYNLLNRLGAGNMLNPGFLNAVDMQATVSLQRDVWDRTSSSDALINRLLAYDFKFTLGDNDLAKVTRMCHAAGVSVGFPMLCDELVMQAAHLPANQKINGTHLRRFFRKALRGYLPDFILEKSKHGFGMPFGEWLLTQPLLSHLAFEALDSLVKRELLQAAFVADIKARVASGHAGYYGTLVWVLMTLELWLRESPFSGIDWSGSQPSN